MFLGNLLKSINKNYRKIHVNGISFDSRTVKKKDIFFAIKGNETSGIKFINDAISKGASVIVSNKKIKYKNNKISFLLVKDVRKSLAEASSNFYKKKTIKYNCCNRNKWKILCSQFFLSNIDF